MITVNTTTPQPVALHLHDFLFLSVNAMRAHLETGHGYTLRNLKHYRSPDELTVLHAQLHAAAR